METLAERIARDGPVSELDAIGWAIRLAKRLEALHGLGVAHGSVSPACILTAGQDRNARAYLADVQHTSASPAYQSPERILGGDISMADDVWALAATLYALLTGQSPFAGANDAEVRQKIMAASPAPLAVFDVGDDDLQHILDAAFRRELARRTSSVNAFRRTLEEWHPDRGVANLPPLEDEDATNDDDDGARTMMVRDSANYLQQNLQVPLPQVQAAAASDDDDDDDNVRTVMRQMPKDDLAAIIARAQAQMGGVPAVPMGPQAAPNPAPVFPMGPQAAPNPAPAAPAPFPMGPQAAPNPALAAPSPFSQNAAGGTAPMAPMRGAPAPQPAQPAGAQALYAQAFGGRPAPAPAPAPAAHDDDDDDDDIRTMMRSGDDPGGDPRTMMLQDAPGAPGAAPPNPWGPRPAAGMFPNSPAAPPVAPPMAPAPTDGGPGAPAPWAEGPSPQGTMALPRNFEPTSPGYGGARPLQAPLGATTTGTGNRGPAPTLALSTSGVMGGFGGLAAPGDLSALEGPPAAPPLAPNLMGSQAGIPGNPASPFAPNPSGAFPAPDPAQLNAMSAQQQQMQPAPQPLAPAAPPREAGASKKGLVIAAIIALLIAAGATFAFLKLRGM